MAQLKGWTRRRLLSQQKPGREFMFLSQPRSSRQRSCVAPALALPWALPRVLTAPSPPLADWEST